ncbi:hypothetical protein N0V90_011957 [Kalmusia sp. IMI 367209]|nr:hypothetical protein N0V90_011957 [Kalmusia sp. IMI 367209]
MQKCPVADIDRALSSYVNPREETLRVRRTLSKYLTASVRPVNAATQNQHLTHETPRDLSAVATNPPGLKGIRSAYLDAIRSHKAAQTRLGTLQASLEEFQQRHVVESPIDDSHPEDEVIHSYIKLLRQRRRLAELEIVQRSLEKLLNINPIEGLRDPRELIKDSIGEQPDLPAERLGSPSPSESSDSFILKLKKEVLEARSKMEKAKSARSEVHDISREVPSLDIQVYALARAREEIVEWVQGELAKMEEESEFIEDASPVKRPVAIPSAQDPVLSETQIQRCYSQYTTSRSAAIEGHQGFQQPTTTHSSNTNNASRTSEVNRREVESPQSQASIVTLLPHLPQLARIHTNERLMLLQAVYLQTQIASADEESNDSLSRLAGESHLLPSGSRGIEHWGKTVIELEAQNAKSIRERLQNSRSEITNIATIVDLCSLHSKVLDSH